MNFLFNHENVHLRAIWGEGQGTLGMRTSTKVRKFNWNLSTFSLIHWIIPAGNSARQQTDHIWEPDKFMSTIMTKQFQLNCMCCIIKATEFPLFSSSRASPMDVWWDSRKFMNISRLKTRRIWCRLSIRSCFVLSSPFILAKSLRSSKTSKTLKTLS